MKIKKYTRSSKLTMDNNKINKQIFIEFMEVLATILLSVHNIKY